MKPINAADVRGILKRRAQKLGSERKLAESFGVSYAYMNDVIRGKRRPGPKILARMDLREVRFYVLKGEGVSL